MFILIYLVGSPIIFLLVSSFKESGLPLDPGFTMANYSTVFKDPQVYKLFLNSIVFSIGSAGVAVFLGLAFAWLMERTNTPFRSISRVMIILPMATPPVLLAVSWVLLLSPQIGLFNKIIMDLFGLETAPLNVYSLVGMIFVQGLAFVPTTFLMLSPVFRNMDPALEEAATISGAGMLTLLRTIVLPILRPGILATSMFLFIVGLVVFEIPGIIGLPVRILVFSSQIFFITHPPSGMAEYGMVSALSMVYLIVIMTAGYVYFRMIKQGQNFTTITGKGYRPRAFSLGRWRYVSFSFFLLYFLFSIAAPLCVLFWTSLLPYYGKFSLEQIGLLSLENYSMIVQHPQVILAIKNTVIVAFSTATVVTLFSAVVSWIVIRVKVKASKLLDVLTFIPVGIPHIMMGLALTYVYLTFDFIPIYGTIWIIVVALSTHYISFGTRTMNGALFQIHRELEEASEVSGATWLRTFVRITLPLIAPAIISVWIWVAGHSMRELSAALMLASGKNTVISTLLWGFWEGGELPATAAVGVVLIMFLIVLLSVAQFIAHKARLSF
ncbi:MAG: iron ABC transporter permease [Pseudomonadota bacterium]